MPPSLPRFAAMFRRNMIALAVTLIASPLTVDSAYASDCRCSCAAFAKFEARVVEFETELDGSAGAMMTPALQTDLACLNPCAEQWMQCRAPGRESIDIVRASSTSARSEKHYRAGTLDNGQPAQRP